MKKNYLISTIGVIAFVIGGIITREKALEGIETLEKKFSKKQSIPPADHQ